MVAEPAPWDAAERKLGAHCWHISRVDQSLCDVLVWLQSLER